jgi:hypothetical protein
VGLGPEIVVAQLRATRRSPCADGPNAGPIGSTCFARRQKQRGRRHQANPLVDRLRLRNWAGPAWQPVPTRRIRLTRA